MKKCLISLFVLLFILLCWASWSLAACTPTTYYIDYTTGNDSYNGTSKSTPWKYSPEMRMNGIYANHAFTGTYSHCEGDTKVFKAGTTWPHVSLQVGGWFGAAGAVDSYLGGAMVTPAWGTGDYAILDGEGNIDDYPHGIAAWGGGTEWAYIRFAGFKVINCYDSRGSGEAFNSNLSNLEVDHNWFEPGSATTPTQGGITFAPFDDAGEFGYSAVNIFIHHNTVRYALQNTFYGVSPGNTSNVQIYNNDFAMGGFNSSVYHPDGYMIGYHPVTGRTTCIDNSYTPVLSNVKFYNNKFHGDWSMSGTGFIYSNGCVDGIEIYNNEFHLDDTSGEVNTSPGFISFGSYGSQADGNISITNNTLSSDAYKGYGAGAGQAISMDSYGTNVIKNNIFSGFGIDINASSIGTLAVDYNMHNIYDNGSGYHYLNWINGTSYSTLHDSIVAGWDTHGKGSCLTSSPWTCTYSSTYPGFVTPSVGTSEPNLHLVVTSPARGAGVAISGKATDKDGVAWGSPPDVGAYSYAPALPTYTVTGATVSHGTTTCASPITQGSTTICTLSASGGYHSVSASSDTCGGSLGGNTYTTGAVTSNCIVTAVFAVNTAGPASLTGTHITSGSVH